MYHIAICDDQKEELDMLYKNVKSFFENAHVPHAIDAYTSSMLLSLALKESASAYDLFLLDIEMPELDGMTLAKQIRDENNNAIILFITSHTEYAIDAFSLDIFRYIPKTLLQSRLTPALTDALSVLSLQSEKYYLVQRNSSTYRLPYTQILYIDRDGKNTVFHLKSGITKERASLDAVYTRLEHHDFTFIEHGIIINLFHAIRLDKNILTLSDGASLTVSRSHLTDVRNAITKYWGNQL